MPLLGNRYKKIKMNFPCMVSKSFKLCKYSRKSNFIDYHNVLLLKQIHMPIKIEQNIRFKFKKQKILIPDYFCYDDFQNIQEGKNFSN